MVYTLSLLKTSDILTTLTRALNDWVYSKQPSVKKSAFAMVVSIISRIVSDNMGFALGGKYTSQSSKNQIVVGLVNGLGAAIMRKPVLVNMMEGVQSDLQAEWVLKALSTTLIESEQLNAGTKFDIDLFGPYSSLSNDS